MAQVTKDTMIGELLQMDMNIAQILFQCGMHCPGCPSARFETLEEAKAKLEELENNLAKNEKKKEKLMGELEESQDWDKIEKELGDLYISK